MFPQPPNPLPHQPYHPLRWHVYCKVIDNYGDVGVAWRLCCNLADRGQQVQLCIDDAQALAWMAPHGHASVQVITGWALPETQFTTNFDVLIECFGCNINTLVVANWSCNSLGNNANKLWINLEYLSAENYAQRNHALRSPVAGLGSAGLPKYFFYPGFVQGTGGLLREPGLAQRQAAFDRRAWLEEQSARCEAPSQFGVDTDHPQHHPQQLVSLFCYEPAALPALLNQLAHGPVRTRLLVTHGRASLAMRLALQKITGSEANPYAHKQLSISYLPALSQTQYDELLWACDLNFVRGEDSLVRALWAGKPFVWHIYPQDDNAHHAKLAAFLQWLGADAGWTAFHHAWNSIAAGPLPPADLAAWAPIAASARSCLLKQADLCSQLLDFVAEKRKTGLK